MFVVVGLSMLVNPQGYLDMATGIIGDAALLYFSCLLGLLGGIALVLAHNVWVADWRVIITVLGWLSVIESAAWILAPRPLARFFGPMITPADAAHRRRGRADPRRCPLLLRLFRRACHGRR